MPYDPDWHDEQIVEMFPRAWPWLFIGRFALLVGIGLLWFVDL